MKKKTVTDYEREAHWEGECLIHPNVAKDTARKVYQLRHGILPHHIYVCHHCDNAHCVLDAHHFPGTQKDNMQDAARKNKGCGKYIRDGKKGYAAGRYTRSDDTRGKLSAAVKSRWAAMTQEERSEIARANQSKISAERKSEIARKRAALYTHEERSEIAKRRCEAVRAKKKC